MDSQDLDRDLGTALVFITIPIKQNLIIVFYLGMRYALQTLKIAIIHTVRKFKLVKCDDTTDEDELFFSIANNGFKGGIKFKVEKLD